MAMAGSSAALRSFTVRRKPAVLVTPSGPTPRELKLLSDIDDQGGLRFYIPVIHFYRRRGIGPGNPAAVLLDAIARALVHYYPFAGRLRELEGRKLAVDCTGEGVLFVEADANVRLDFFGDAALQPPFPGLEELMYDVCGPHDLLDTPLFLFQACPYSRSLMARLLYERVMKAKREVDLKYVRSVARLMARRGRPTFTVVNAYLVSDVTKVGMCDLDYGWGKPVYAGPAKGGVGATPGIASFLVAVKNNAMGEDGIVVPVCLPGTTMDKFVEEMSKVMPPAMTDMSPKIMSAM